MRRLEFKGPHIDTFPLVWEGLNTGAGPLKGLNRLRVGLSISNKLAAISHPNGDRAREVSLPTRVDLTSEEWEFLKHAMEAAPWLINHADAAIRAIEFVRAAPEVEEE